MCFFKRKSVADKVKQDRELIVANSKSIEALIILAKDNTEIVEKLKDLQEKLRFLIPSDVAKVMDFDKSIKNKIGDLRIILTKTDGEITKKVENCIVDIELAIVDRNTKL